jgi:hypothetical protein
MWALVIVVALVAVVFFVLRGSPELARLEVHDGKLSHRSGRMPPRLLSDFEDALRDSRVDYAIVRIVLDGARPRVTATGLPEDVLQRFRNLTGRYETPQFRTGRPARR